MGPLRMVKPWASGKGKARWKVGVRGGPSSLMLARTGRTEPRMWRVEGTNRQFGYLHLPGGRVISKDRVPDKGNPPTAGKTGCVRTKHTKKLLRSKPTVPWKGSTYHLRGRMAWGSIFSEGEETGWPGGCMQGRWHGQTLVERGKGARKKAPRTPAILGT